MINNKSFLLLLSFCLMMCHQSFSQKSAAGNKCDCGFGALAQAGTFVAGEALPGGNFQSVVGFRYKEWFGGVGAGIDFYRYRSIPVFVDIRRTIFRKPTAPFVYADIGVNYPWLRNFEKEDYYKPQDFRTGYYFDIGAGYRFHLAKHHHILFSAGYTEKRTREDRAIADYGCGALPCPDKIDRFSYTMKRIIIRVGWALW